ncbi:MAG: aminotransferase class I/II-fold pyridoxal phosphate-dependent enzyme [Rubripirellula sp.]
MNNWNFQDFTEQLDSLAETNRLRQLVPRRCDGVHLVETDGRRLLNFGGNDYLGLAMEFAVDDVAAGSGASSLVCGWTEAHQRLADWIAEFESTESAVLFPTGFAACSGAISALAGKGDLILSDELNHASLIDGCRLSNATCVVYPHRDYHFVEESLRNQRDQFRRVWIATDGVFSMDGHLAPLGQLCDIAEEHDACMIVDEAHGTGLLGDRGSGVCEALDVKDRVAVRIGTLSKAVGCQGGFVAGPKPVIDFLINHCRPLIFSTSLAPPAVAAAARALKVIRDQPERRHQVQQMAKRFRQELVIDVGELESLIPIVPIIVGGDQRALEISKCLADRGFYVPAIRPPTVPSGAARLRVSISAAHDHQMIDQLADEITDLL